MIPRYRRTSPSRAPYRPLRPRPPFVPGPEKECIDCHRKWAAEPIEGFICFGCQRVRDGLPRNPPQDEPRSYRPGPMSDGYATADAMALAALPVILVAFAYAVMSL
jgi:hypothetical protein